MARTKMNTDCNIKSDLIDYVNRAVSDQRPACDISHLQVNATTTICCALFIVVLFLGNIFFGNIAFAVPTKTEKKDSLLGSLDEAPTFVKADRLLLKNKDRIFEYSGNVEVKHGDLTLTSNALEGIYDDKNQITALIAKKDVHIVKGLKIKANSQKATYDRKTDTLVLTENPQVEQDGSILSADIVRIFLKEDRSEAEGQVNVKLVKPTPGPTPTAG